MKSDKDCDVLVGIPVGRKPVLLAYLKQQLVERLLEVDKRFHGLWCEDVMKLAYQLCERNSIEHLFRKSGAKTQVDEEFPKEAFRVDSARPQGVSKARVHDSTKDHVSNFFDLYEAEINAHGISRHRVFNVDGTGFTIVQHKHSKVISIILGLDPNPGPLKMFTKKLKESFVHILPSSEKVPHIRNRSNPYWDPLDEMREIDRT